MARRLGLARAMLHRPPVLLLDEPTRSLDPEATEHFHQVLQRIRHDFGVTTLLTTHDMVEAATCCDHVSALHAGRITGHVTPLEEASPHQAVSRLVSWFPSPGLPPAGSPPFTSSAAVVAATSGWSAATVWPSWPKFGGAFTTLLSAGFLSRLVPSGQHSLSRYGGDYFTFVLIGTASLSYFTVALGSFADSLSQEQQHGTLETLLATPNDPRLLLLFGAAWPFLFSTGQLVVYLVAGGVLFHAHIASAHILLAAAVMLLTVVAFDRGGLGGRVAHGPDQANGPVGQSGGRRLCVVGRRPLPDFRPAPASAAPGRGAADEPRSRRRPASPRRPSEPRGHRPGPRSYSPCSASLCCRWRCKASGGRSTGRAGRDRSPTTDERRGRRWSRPQMTRQSWMLSSWMIRQTLRSEDGVTALAAGAAVLAAGRAAA